MSDTWWVKSSQLSPEQRDIVGITDLKNRLVLGPPGSGKTNILLLRAKYLIADKKPDVQIIVFTKALRRFVATGRDYYGVAADKIITSTKWSHNLLRDLGGNPNPPADFTEARNYYSEEIAKLVNQKKIDKLHDAILLDEAQDYTFAEIQMFAKVAKHLFAVADSRQQIYSATDDPVEALKKLVDHTHELRSHYRCGRKICELADALRKYTTLHKPLVDSMMYDEGEYPSSVTCDSGSLRAQCDLIVHRLTDQMRVYPGQFLGIACPRRDGVARILAELHRHSQIARHVCQVKEDAEAFDGQKNICLGTIHDMKGLELRALHVPEADTLRDMPHPRNLAFTAVTRAKTSLSFYHEGDMVGYLDSAIRSVLPKGEKPTVESLFPEG
jgi:superfamily I DNA and RNA helicase